MTYSLTESMDMAMNAFEHRPRTRAATDRLALGLVLIVLGLLLALDQAGLWAVGGLHELWPLFLVALGLGRLASPARRGSGVMMLGLGLIFLAQTGHVAPLHQTWPLILVLAGISMLLRRHDGACARPQPPDERAGWQS